MNRAFKTSGCEAAEERVLFKEVSLAQMHSAHMGRGRASGHRQPSMGRDHLMNVFPTPPHTLSFITRFLVLWLHLCLSDEVRVVEFATFCIHAGSSV